MKPALRETDHGSPITDHASSGTVRVERIKIAARLLCAAALAALPAHALAQSYPAKAIRIIVPFPPAGAADLLTRTIGQKLTEAWGQQIIVDNRPGVGGNLGVEIAAKSSPDG